MSLKVSYPTRHEESWTDVDGMYGACGNSATRDVPAKILVSDQYRNLIPCNYQYWFCANVRGVLSGNLYISSGKQPINPEALTIIKRESFESKVEEGEGFHDFIRDLMDNPPPGVQFIKYEGAEKMTPPQKSWHVLGINIARKQRARFVHRFSLCSLRS